MTIETIILIIHITGASLLIGVAIIATASVVKPPQTVKFINWLYKTGKFGLWVSFLGIANRHHIILPKVISTGR